MIYEREKGGNPSTKEIFQRTELLMGEAYVSRLAQTRVILFGVGGVGSWCAECLVRSGIGHLTIVDCDRVCASNVNRQLMATSCNIGQLKVEALRERLLSINPAADVEAQAKVYCTATADEWDLNSYDYVVDAIDSLSDKALLILRACKSRARLISSMGAALKMDATQIRVAEFWDAKGCPLARALRKKFKRDGQMPSRKFKCVYSPELLENRGTAPSDDPSAHADAEGPQPAAKAQSNGSMMHITATFGLMMAGEILKHAQKALAKEEADSTAQKSLENEGADSTAQ